MKKRLLSTIAVCFFLICNVKAQQQPATPMEMSNYLTGVVAAIAQKSTAWANMFIEVQDTKEFGAIVPFRIEIQKYLAAKSVEMSTMQDIGGSEEFRKAIIGFLNYENDLVQKALVPLESLNKDSKKREIKKLVRQMVKTVNGETPLLDKIRLIQKEYAAKNGFKIQE